MTKAADMLFISVSALKSQMDTLENECEVKLLDRSPKGVSLTYAGKLFREKAEGICASVNDALWEIRHINADAERSVYIGFRHMKITDYLYPEYIMNFLKKYPDADVKLVDVNENSYKNIDLLMCDYLSSPEFDICHHLRDMPVQCIMRGDHPLSKQGELNLQDLERRHLIIPPMPIFKYLAPDLAEKLVEGKYAYEESLLNKEVIYMNLLPSDNILLTFGDESYISNVLVHRPLKGFFVEYCIRQRSDMTKPIAKAFLSGMLKFYSKRRS